MSQHAACLIKRCFVYLSFLSLGKLSRGGRGWRAPMAPAIPDGTQPKHPNHSQHLTGAPKILCKGQSSPGPPLSYASSGASHCTYPPTPPARNMQSQGLPENTRRAIRLASSHFLRTAGSNEKEMPRRKKSSLTAALLDVKQKSQLLRRNFWRYLSPG